MQQMTEKLERRKFQLHSVQRHIESLEIALVQAEIELKLRRNRQLFAPTPTEIHAACEAEAARVRKIQEKHRPRPGSSLSCALGWRSCGVRGCWTLSTLLDQKADELVGAPTALGASERPSFVLS